MDNRKEDGKMDNRKEDGKMDNNNYINEGATIKVNTTILEPGLILANNVYLANGTVLCAAGLKLTEPIIKGLINKNIQEVTIFLNSNIKSYDNNPNYTIDEKTYNETIKIINSAKISDILKAAVELKLMVEKVNKLNYNLEHYNSPRKSASRSINVCTFAIILANAYNKYILENKDNSSEYNNSYLDIDLVAQAAIFFNYGEYCQEEKTLKGLNSKRTPPKDTHPGLVSDCFQKYSKEMIPLYSFNMLSNYSYNNNDEVNSLILWTILHSQEDQRGDGPLGYKLSPKKEDSKFLESKSAMAQIISLCIKFDEILTFSVKNNSTLENVSTMLAYYRENNHYDETLVNLIYKTIPLYPIGAKVLLSTGEYATVVENFTNEERYGKPNVKTDNGETGIDLVDENISIMRLIARNDNLTNTEIPHEKGRAM